MSSDVWLVIVGAAIGFAGSVIGGLLQARLHLRRETRMRALFEIAPQLRKSEQHRFFSLDEPLDSLSRLAVLLSAKEKRAIDALELAHDQRKQDDMMNSPSDEWGGRISSPNAEPLENRFSGAVTELESILKAKLKSRLRL